MQPVVHSICVLVWKYDRFARSLAVLVSALQQFSTLGTDYTKLHAEYYRVIGSFAEFEREMIV